MSLLSVLYPLVGASLFLFSKFSDSVAISPNRLTNKGSNVIDIANPILNPPVSASSPYSLPWCESVQPGRILSYMPMLQKQLEVMKCQQHMEKVEIQDKFAFMASTVKPARISSMTFKNSIFRKIRLTYFDAGDSVQVLNSLWYPDYKYDVPMLGIDLISLGKNRVLSVIDLQPLHPSTEYSDTYITPLTTIRNKYPDLQGVLSGKFYDDTSFFSKNMLFGRFSDESKLTSAVEPAMEEYLNHYVKLANEAVPDSNETSMKIVHERQKAYDCYQAIKDPAVGLFDAYFGKEWTTSFVHDYLFDLSAKPEGIPYTPPVHNFKIPSS